MRSASCGHHARSRVHRCRRRRDATLNYSSTSFVGAGGGSIPERVWPLPGMYRWGEGSFSGSGLGDLAARAARSSFSLSSSCILDFLSSKNANRICEADGLAHVRTWKIRRFHLLFLSFDLGFFHSPGFRQTLLLFGFTLFEFLENGVAG